MLPIFLDQLDGALCVLVIFTKAWAIISWPFKWSHVLFRLWRIKIVHFYLRVD